MPAGWVGGVCRDGEKDAGMKIGRTRWVARGGIGVSATGGGKASLLVAEVGGTAAVMRVLVALVDRLGGEAAMPSVTHYCDTQALTKRWCGSGCTWTAGSSGGRRRGGGGRR